MARSSRGTYLAGFIGLFAWSLASCSHPTAHAALPSSTAAPAVVAVHQKGVTEKPLRPVAPPGVETATITYLTGTVQANDSGSWSAATIGETLRPESRIRVGSGSYCEIQFGNLAVARVEANTEVSIAKLVLGTVRQVRVALKVGAVVSHVQKLIGNDQYQVETETAVAGVRGTEFRVSASPANDTEIGVREGVVTVIPRAALLGFSSPANRAIAHRVESAATAQAPTVTANEELTISPQEFAGAAGEFARIRKRVGAGASSVEIGSLVTKVMASVAAATPKPVPLSRSEQIHLAVAPELLLLPTAPAARKTTPAPQAVPLLISVIPDRAELFVDNRPAGIGSFSALFEPGRKLEVSLRLAGYVSRTVPVTVPDKGIALSIVLAKTHTPGPPASAAKTVEKPHVAPAASAPAAVRRSPVRVSAPIRRGAATITVRPAAAEISVGGRRVGSGHYRASYRAGTTLTIEAALRGYAPASTTLRIKADSDIDRTLTLRPRPIEARLHVSRVALVRSIAVWKNDLISADKRGVLRSISSGGKLEWQVATGNTPDQNSRPVVYGNNVFFSGAAEFVGIDALTGSVLFRHRLGQADAHLFGRSVSARNGEIYYPTNNRILVYADRSGKVLRSFRLPGHSYMSALLSGQDLYIVDQAGALYELNAKNGRTLAVVRTRALQPVAIAPVRIGNDIFFAGRRGTAVLADPPADKVLWQKPLDKSRAGGVFTDPVRGGQAVYVVASHTLYGLSLASGKELFSPISNVSASPLYLDGSLYFGTTKGSLVRANALTGVKDASVDVGAPITTRPVAFGGDIAVGTATGEIVLVYPGTMAP